MSTSSEILLERIDAQLATINKSRYWLSMQITGGTQHGVVRDIGRKGTMPGADRLLTMAETLGTTTDYLLGKTDNPAPVRSEVSFKDVRRDWIAPEPERIPVLGTGYCEDLVIEGDGGDITRIERIMLETDHTVSMVRRPAALWNAKDAYAIYFHGSSMEPRFYQGEIGIVDPRRPPSPGDFVVVQLNDGESDTVQTVLVKQLIRLAGDFYQLAQFNPATTFRIARSRVARIHRIASPNELYGG
jgi:hypothetical protein